MTTLLVLIIVLVFIGVPVAIAMGLSSYVYLLGYKSEKFLLILPQMMTSGIYSFPLLAIPFFTLCGVLMKWAGITRSLVIFCQTAIGKVRGGLAYVNVLASVLFAGISGSAVADVSAIGNIIIPSMEQDGYSKEFSSAVTAASSVLGPIIPPSLIAIVYCNATGLSVGALFATGLVPGLILAGFQCLYIKAISKKKNLPVYDVDFSLLTLWNAFSRAIVALIMPLIILGGIFSGVFTATESAAVASVYAFFIGSFVTRKIRLRDLPAIMAETATGSATVYLIIATATCIQWIVGREKVGEIIVAAVHGISENPISIKLIVIGIIFLVGMFMDTNPAIVIFTPLLAPIMKTVGIGSLHFGAIMVIALAMGLITPPFGMSLFVTSSVAKLQYDRMCIAILPFVLIHLTVLLLLVFFPEISLFLPRLLGFTII